MHYSNTVYFYKFSIFLFSLVVFILMAIPGFTAEMKKNINALKPSIQACEYVASLANKGQLPNVLLQTAPDDSTDIKVPEDISGTVFKRIMDINNDGIMERVFVESQGTAHFENFSVYKLKTDEEIEMKALWNDNWPDDNERWAADRAFVEYKSTTYVLGKTGQSLSYLLYINPKNEMQVICEFGQREKPLQRLKKSRNDKVCKQALSGQISHVEYNKLHSLSYNEVCNAGFRETHPGDKAALIDIDNDGKKELVVSLNLSSGSGRGCDSTFPAVLTGNRTSIDKKYIEKLPFGRCGGTEVNPFIIDGKTYLDERQPGAYAQHRQVYMLNKDKLETICEFEVRPMNYVLNPVEKIKKNRGDKDIWEYAIAQPGTDTTEMLIKAGEDINKTPHSSPLIIAIRNKRIDILEILLKAGADPNNRAENDVVDGWPLVTAVREKMIEGVKLLFEYGARGNEIACSNALMWAIGGSTEMLEYLLDNGVQLTDDRVIEAVRNNSNESLKVLIARGLDVHRKYTTDWFLDIKEQAPGVISVNSNVKSKKVSKTLMEWAMESRDIETLRLLKEASEKQDNGGLLRQLRDADAELNEAYRIRSEGLPKPEAQKLRNEQRSWIRQRDTKCKSTLQTASMDAWFRYVAADENKARCVMDVTYKRTAELSAKQIQAVISPDEKVEGVSQTEWSKRYWEWSKSFLKGQTPADDPTGSRCMERQSGAVVMLTGSSGSKPVSRICEVPMGKYLFFPVMTSLADVKPDEKHQCNSIRLLLDEMTKNVSSMYVQIDGEMVANIKRHRQTTECFGLNAADKEIYAASDGYWLMLRPLTPGKHTIRFGGHFPDGFSQEVRYELVVKE